MSRKDKLEREISFLQEEFRGYFLLLVALLSGEAGLIYAVVSGEKPIYVLVLAIFGFAVVGFLYAKIQKIKNQIYKNINDIEKE